jgi:hypothetical protein
LAHSTQIVALELHVTHDQAMLENSVMIEAPENHAEMKVV